MLFVRSDDLKPGMRLAKPIYDKNGVLLYNRNTKLSHQSIVSIKNFNLIGIYILEPAEPLPPMTELDIEFERMQTVSVFALIEVYKQLQKSNETAALEPLVQELVRTYGHLEHKMNFIQNMRSAEDYLYKHSLNTAILCALMSHKMNVKAEQQADLVAAALLHDLGQIYLPDEILKQTAEPSEAVRNEIKRTYTEGNKLCQESPSLSANTKKILAECHTILHIRGTQVNSEPSVLTKILVVADAYDSITAMQLNGEPSSPYRALMHFQRNTRIYGAPIIAALTASIDILAAGTCVELTNGLTGLVISGDRADCCRPAILSFHDNQIYDLGDSGTFAQAKVLDVMKSMDNRAIKDPEVYKQWQKDYPEMFEQVKMQNFLEFFHSF